MAERIRLFFGVDMPDTARVQLSELQRCLQEVGVRAGNWSRPELFHATLLFLGDCDTETIPKLAALGSQIARDTQPFSLSVTGPGMFERNRILWAGLQEDEGVKALAELHRRIDASIGEVLPIGSDTRPYRAHITLARKLDPQTMPQVQAWLDGQDGQDAERGNGQRENGQREIGQRENGQRRIWQPFRWEVADFCLFASTQVNGRLTYPVLHRFPFVLD